MTRQLSLIESAPAWRIDERTRERGRRGVAEARAALQSALARAAGSDDSQADPQRPAA